MRRTKPIHARAVRLRVLLALVLATLFLQACARDAASETTDGASAPAGQSAAAPTEEGAAAPVTNDSEAPGQGDAGSGGQGQVAGVDLSADFCTMSAQLRESDVFNQNPATAEEMASRTEEMTQVYSAFVDKAPAKISDDVQLVMQNATQQMQLLNERVAAAPEDIAEILEDPEVAAEVQQLGASKETVRATERVARWREKNC
jgi:hypothetical protein